MLLLVRHTDTLRIYDCKVFSDFPPSALNSWEFVTKKITTEKFERRS